MKVVDEGLLVRHKKATLSARACDRCSRAEIAAVASAGLGRDRGTRSDIHAVQQCQTGVATRTAQTNGKPSEPQTETTADATQDDSEAHPLALRQRFPWLCYCYDVISIELREKNESGPSANSEARGF